MLSLARSGWTRGRPSARVVVWIVVVVALTSIATGVAAIVTRPGLEATGPLGDLQAVTEFSGAVLGFALLVTAWGMRRGYRIAYVAATGLVFLSGVHGVVQSRLLSIPLIVLSIGGLLVLVLTSQRFTRSSSVTATQLGALIGIVGVFCYGTAGAYALRSGFDDVETVIDAIYFTIVTASTVGYGDVHPTTESTRLFTISLIVLGPTTVAVAVGSLFEPAMETRLSLAGRRAKGRRSSEIERERERESEDERERDGDRERDHDRSNRLVVLGGDERTEPIIGYLSRAAGRSGRPLVIVTIDERSARRLRDGARESPDSAVADASVVVGDPAGETTLERIDLTETDTVLVATGDDARTRDAVSAARDVTNGRIVALGDDGRDEFERAGADVTIDPDRLLGRAVAEATLEPE